MCSAFLEATRATNGCPSFSATTPSLDCLHDPDDAHGRQTRQAHFSSARTHPHPSPTRRQTRDFGLRCTTAPLASRRRHEAKGAWEVALVVQHAPEAQGGREQAESPADTDSSAANCARADGSFGEEGLKAGTRERLG